MEIKLYDVVRIERVVVLPDTCPKCTFNLKDSKKKPLLGWFGMDTAYACYVDEDGDVCTGDQLDTSDHYLYRVSCRNCAHVLVNHEFANLELNEKTNENLQVLLKGILYEETGCLETDDPNKKKIRKLLGMEE